MSKLTVPAEVQAFLKNAKGVTELVDEQGQRLGEFTPAPTAEDYARALAAYPYTEEERKRAREDPNR